MRLRGCAACHALIGISATGDLEAFAEALAEATELPS
jgi:hypothetical protein